MNGMLRRKNVIDRKRERGGVERERETERDEILYLKRFILYLKLYFNLQHVELNSPTLLENTEIF